MLRKIIIYLITLFLFQCSYIHAKHFKNVQVIGKSIIIEYDNNLKSRVLSNFDQKKIVLGNFSYSEFLSIDGKPVQDFQLKDFTSNDWKDSLGNGKQYEITGTSKDLLKKIQIISYDQFPEMLFFKVTYRNTGSKELTIDGWTNNNYSVIAPAAEKNSHLLWSYQPGSYGWDNDWILPLKAGYNRDNNLGMNAVDYGGGTPVADIWRPEIGVAVGHVELVPKLVFLPVSMPDAKEAFLGIKYEKKTALKPNEEITTFRTFAAVHKGDHYNSLTAYRQFMERQGIKFKDAPEDAYKTEWCGWGYEANFTMEQYYNTFPKVKELGLEWIVLDMGWYKGLGDYHLPKDKFPNGEADVKKLISDIHSYDAKAQLWWMPLSAAPNTELFSEHFDYLLINEDGSPRFMPSFFKAFFLCPAYKPVQEYSKNLVARFMREGWDGLKIDGNNLNGVPPCYNPEHKHAYPEESVEALPQFFKIMYETALSINPNAVIEICPCGTNQSFFIQPYMNQCVASDPHTSWTIREKGKTLKALTGSKSVYYGDHVELSDNRSDFASTIGVGGVIGTKFIYPPGSYMNTESGDVSLTPEKEIEWKKWIRIYKENMLTKGNYRGELYDIGFDYPETHAIQKDKVMYYSIYAPEYNGEVELRGLTPGKYRITDYENNKVIGECSDTSSKIKVNFQKHLLIKAEPING